MSGTIAPVARQVFLDNSGNPVSGGLLYSWAAGTSTELPIYADLALSTECTNPVILNAAGRPTVNGSTETNIYFSAATYKLELRTSAGVSIWIADNVPAVPSLATALDITGIAGENLTALEAVYLADGSGGTTLGSWYRADSDATASSSTAGTVGMVPSSIASGQSGSIRLQGRITGLVALTPGGRYYVAAAAGTITTTPPTNQRYIGQADSTTSIVVDGNPGAVRMPDSDGTHSLVIKTTSNLTADRILTFVPGDASRTVTITADVTLPSVAVTGRCGFRLSLTTGVPVTTADVTAATTLYCTPSGAGNQLELYDASGVPTSLTSAQFSIAVPATTNTLYSVFAYNNAGVATLELAAWTNLTTPGTAAYSVASNGVWCKTGDLTRRLIGLMRTTGVSGQTESSAAKRFVGNLYNQVDLVLIRIEATNSWVWSTAAWHQANASTANQVSGLIIVPGMSLDLTLLTLMNESVGGNAINGIGEDGVAGPITGSPIAVVTMGNNIVDQNSLRVVRYPAIGSHDWTWLEYAQSGGVTTWYGDNGGALYQTGMNGKIQG